MLNEHVDLHLAPAHHVDPLDLYIRADGLLDDAQLQAVRRGLASTMRRGGVPDSPEPRHSITAGLEVVLATPGRASAHHEARQELLERAVSHELGQLDAQPELADQVCVCASAVPGDRIPLRVEDMHWWVDGVWTPPPVSTGMPPQDTWRIAVALDSAPFNYAVLTLRDGATFTPPVSSDEVLVGLANVTDWPKEIWADNLCSGRLGSVYQDGPNGTPHRMLLRKPVCRAGADTIVFRKPGFFGIWHDVGHFPPELFWWAFGGTVADFNWVVD